MAKFLLAPGTYTAGQAIPLIGTAFRSNSVYADGEAAVLRGSGCFHNPAQYDVAVHAIIVTAGTGIVNVDLVQDGTVLPDAGIALPAAAGTLSEQSVTQVSTVDTSRLVVRATTAVTITTGNLIVTRRA